MKLALIVTVLLLLAGCSAHQAEPLPVYDTVPAFTLTSHTGGQFDSAELRGKVWVANFIFTNCPGPCPRMTTLMSEIQKATRHLADVKLVSFTVDPERDTPEVLAAYAKRYGAGPGWYFLTGAVADIHRLSSDGFKLGTVDGELEHSSRFVLVDRQSRIRGYYSSLVDGDAQRLAADIRRLEKETL